MSLEVPEIQEPWEQVEEGRETTIVSSHFPQISFSTCVHVDTLWTLPIIFCSTSLSKPGVQWRLLASPVCALQQRLLRWITRCCSAHVRHCRMATLPSGQSFAFFSLPKPFWRKVGPLPFACLIANVLVGKREANDCFMSEHHFKILKILLANEINLGA